MTTNAAELPITVLIPTRNIASYLPAALESVRVQQGPWRVIGVDSSSSDGSAEIWAEFAAAHPDQVRVIDAPECRLSDAINIGVVAAEPGLVQWIGGDDRVAPEAHAAIRRTRAAHPDAGWFAGHVLFRDAAGAELRRGLAEPWNLQRMVAANRYFAPAVVYDRRFAIRSGLASPALRRTMDYDWWFRMALLDDPVIIDAVLAEFTLRDGALSGDDNALATATEVARVGRFYADTLAERKAWTKAMLTRWAPIWARTRLHPAARALGLAARHRDAGPDPSVKNTEDSRCP